MARSLLAIRAVSERGGLPFSLSLEVDFQAHMMIVAPSIFLGRSEGLIEFISMKGPKK